MVFALGTAQLGLHYGISNTKGLLTDAESYAIMDRAYRLGFVAVDLDVDHYGEATRRVKTYLDTHCGAFKVLRRGEPGYISTYDPIMAITSAYRSDVRIVQVPANVLDGRMDGVIKRLKRVGKTVVVRSLFLQGLLGGTSSPNEYTGNGKIQDKAKDTLTLFAAYAKAYDMTVSELAARWVWELDPDVALVGAERPEQLDKLVEWVSIGPLPKELVATVQVARQGIEAEIITPTMWGQDFAFGPGSS